jgi:hypothetical protein
MRLLQLPTTLLAQVGLVDRREGGDSTTGWGRT